MSPVRSALPRLGFFAWLVLAACGGAEAKQEPGETTVETATEPARDPYEGYPLYGLVTGTQLVVRKEPSPEGLTVGWLRRGEIVRLKTEVHQSPTCRSGWHEIHPRGYACVGEGISISDAPPQVADEDRAQANRNAPLPYQYYMVKEARAAEYHQLPSRDQQRAVRDYVSALLAVEKEGDAQKLKRFLEGKLPNQPKKHAIVRRFLERGFYVAGTSVAVRSRRRFVHTVRGSYVKEQELLPRSGSDFKGVELGNGRTLPVVWAVRTGVPLERKTRDDGTTTVVEKPGASPIERLSLIENYKGMTRVNGQLMHELADGSLLRHWFLTVAEKTQRPKEVGKNEPWVHVDLSSQTLVLYVGDDPKYATLVSTGLDTHPTPVGSFRIQRKYVSDSMADIGADAADDRYSIDDVPWTQYFEGAKALHAAFWHSHFGIKRSHGCVNLAPQDAFYVFQHTWPEVPAGWHGVSTQRTGLKGSLVVVTE